MAARMPFTLLSVLLLSSMTLPGSSLSNIDLWCRRTPNPELCLYYMRHISKTFNVNRKPEFATAAMVIALEQAIRLKNFAMQIGDMIQNEGEKAAWDDCYELFDNTILRLKQTVSNYGMCTNSDIQTWLSTALTNVETCLAGYIEMGVSNGMLRHMSNTVSKLISNALVINKVAPRVPWYNNVFPTWVPDHDQMLLLAPSPSPSPGGSGDSYLVVAQDGSGDFGTINEAIEAASKREWMGRFLIYVKEGNYNEYVQIDGNVKNITMVGDGIGKTIVTGNKHAGGNTTTFRTATFAVTGDGFIARDITFRNTAGPSNGQAVALRSGSDFSVFYKCSFEGYQDTLYVHSSRQFYRECNISGTVDFIFGNAVVIFQNCSIYVRRPLRSTNTITAQNRSDPHQNTGIVIHNSEVLASEELNPVLTTVRTYLGRPWGNYSRTVVLKTYLGSLIDPAGWSKWDDNTNVNELYYGECNNSGPGSSTAKRVQWGGFHDIRSLSEASKFTVENFLDGDSWLPSTNLPYTSGL
ncbi:unnamed protein product [Ilex paraguariensis]|uniref:Pectinesterase n=1 Tax=Ilex paraguariensis TaxID=185542 RepID=A0ABC8UGA8_9AQUA